MNNNVIFTSTANEFILFFSIRKITNKIPKLLTDNINSTKLVLNSFDADADLGGRNSVLTWRNINFKLLLGDEYELNAMYNISVYSVAFNETVINATFRVGTLVFVCNSLTFRYGDSNKWLIPLTHTTTTPNSRTFRGAFTNTFLMNSEQGDITITYIIHHTNAPPNSTVLPERLLYFIINKI